MTLQRPTKTIVWFASVALPVVVIFTSTQSATAGYTWTQITASGPAARYDHTMVYDSTGQKVILFGGRDASSSFNDLWQWDSGTATWTQLSSTGATPSARYGHAMAYDSNRDKVVVFGGWDASGRENDLWEWDPVTSTWMEIILPAPLPPARRWHGMAYDPLRAQLVIHGGSGAAGALSDTWEWNGNPANAWVHKSTLPCLPPPNMGMCPRFDFGMAYNEATATVVLFGGTDGFNCSSIDSLYQSFDFTYEWNGTAWGIDPQTGGNPERRHKHEFVFDSVSDKMVFYGGTQISCAAGGGVESDTWTWENATDWFEQSTSSAYPRAGHAMAFDPTIGGTGGVIVHGGYSATQLHGNTLVGYEIPGGTTNCPPPFDLNNPSSYRHRVFKVTGTASGTPWSWSISWGGFTIYEPFAPGVTPGGSAADLCAAFVASINAQSCASNELAAFVINGNPTHFRVIIGGNKTPSLCVGPANQQPTCCVSTVNTCPFNPDLSEILLSGEDCNANGMDDTIDLLSDGSLDQNGNGIIDSCEATPGDLNCDEVIDGADISAFVLARVDAAGYEEQYPTCNIANADLDGDGELTEIDNAILIELLMDGE